MKSGKALMEKTNFYPPLVLLAVSADGEVERRARAEFPSALQQHCRAEAEQMWQGIEKRLCISRTRHREFVRDMTANLLRKVDRKTRDAVWKKLIRTIAEDYRATHHGIADAAARPA
jgi:hypothetical protein